MDAELLLYLEGLASTRLPMRQDGPAGLRRWVVMMSARRRRRLATERLYFRSARRTA